MLRKALPLLSASIFLYGCSTPTQLDRVTSRLAEAVTKQDTKEEKTSEKSPTCVPGVGSGYVRIDYLEGNASSIYVTGLSKAYTLQRGEFISDRMPLGEIAVVASAGSFKRSDEIKVCLDKPNQIVVLSFSALDPDHGVVAIKGSLNSLINGYGSLKVVTDLDGITFGIESTLVENFMLCPDENSAKLRSVERRINASCIIPKDLRAPSEFFLSAGEYVIKTKNKQDKITVLPGMVTIHEIR